MALTADGGVDWGGGSGGGGGAWEKLAFIVPTSHTFASSPPSQPLHQASLPPLAANIIAFAPAVGQNFPLWGLDPKQRGFLLPPTFCFLQLFASTPLLLLASHPISSTISSGLLLHFISFFFPFFSASIFWFLPLFRHSSPWHSSLWPACPEAKLLASVSPTLPRCLRPPLEAAEDGWMDGEEDDENDDDNDGGGGGGPSKF
jgi:hypothetical protein